MGLLDNLLGDPIGILRQIQAGKQGADNHIQRLNDPGLQTRLAQWDKSYWWMDPGAIFSLAATRNDPFSPAAQNIAKAAAVVKNESGLGWSNPGAPMDANRMPNGTMIQGVADNGSGTPSTLPLGTPDAIDTWQAQLDGPRPGSLSPVNYAAGDKPPISNVFPDDKWRALPQQVKEELGNIQMQQVDPSTVSGARTGGTAQQVYQMMGADNLSQPARDALHEAVGAGTGGMSVIGPMFGQITGAGAGTYSPPGQGANYLSLGKPLPTSSSGQYGNILGSTPIQQASVIPSMDNVSSAWQGAQQGIQAAAVTVAAPLQEMAGQVRNLYELENQHDNPNWLQSQSDLGVWAGSGFHKDIGGGLLGAAPDSPVHQELLKRQAERGLINGVPVTIGRWVASNPLGWMIPGANTPGVINDATTAMSQRVIPPGSLAYQGLSGAVDAAFALKMDPTIFALRGLGEYRQAADTIAPGSIREATQAAAEGTTIPDRVGRAVQAFRDAGGIGSLTHGAVDSDAANRFLASEPWWNKANQLAGTSGDDAVYKIMSDFNWQIQPKTAVAIADSTDPVEITNIARDDIGARITDKPTMSNLDSPLVLHQPQGRWWMMLPEHQMELGNPAANIQQVREIGAMVKMKEIIPSYVDQMARATSTSESRSVFQKMFDDVAMKLVDKAGVTKPDPANFTDASGSLDAAGYAAARRDYNQVVDRAMGLTRMNQADNAAQGTYAVQAVGDGMGMSTSGVSVKGEVHLITQSEPQRLAQTLNSAVTFPDFRELTRALSPGSRIYENGLVQSGNELLTMGQKVWKYAQIANAKAMVKILGDEQARIAARGYVSLWNHPLQAIGMVVGSPAAEIPEDAGFLMRLRNNASTGLRWTGAHLPTVEPSLTQPLAVDGEAAWDRMAEVQRYSQSTLDAATTDRGTIFSRWFEPIQQGQPGVSDEAFLTAHANSLANMAASPETRTFARMNTLQEMQDWYWDGGGQNLREELAKRLKNADLGGENASRVASDEQVAREWNNILAATNGNPELIDAIAHGRLRDAGTVYHGTSRDFTEFSPLEMPQTAEQRIGMTGDDLAHYFSEDRSIAQDYGDKVIAAKLRAQNPLVKEGGGPFQIRDIQNAKAAGHDVIVHQEQGRLAYAVLDPSIIDKSSSVSMFRGAADGSAGLNDAFKDKLLEYSDDFPKATLQQRTIISKSETNALGRISNNFLHALIGTPSNTLSKSPLFKQAYWENVADNASFFSVDAQQQILRDAGAANLPGPLMDEVIAGIKKGAGNLAVKDADDIAKEYALDVVQRTTHDLSRKSQLMDQLRLVAPFGEIWRKTIRSWANIISENPNVMRTLQKSLLQLQSPGMGEFFGQPAGQGFFHKDQYGQEVFSIPGSEFASMLATDPRHLGANGIPVPLTGNVMGLSVGTEIMPGLGPVVSMPVAFLAHQIDLNPDLMKQIFPYGDPRNPTDLWNVAPSWARNALGKDRPSSPEDQRIFANAVKSVLGYGMTNGDYDMSTPEGQKSALADATHKAHILYGIQGLSQFTIPGAPSQEYLLRDKDGKLIDAGLLVQAYQNMADPQKKVDGIPGDPTSAPSRFMEKYGPNVLAAVTPKSYAYTFGIPTDPAAAKWVDAHSDIKTKFSNIYGYFAPPSDPNKFDYNLYLDQMAPGQGRQQLSPEQWVGLGQAKLAGIEYGKARDRIDKMNNGKAPDAGQRAYLSTYKQYLVDHYPGYSAALYGGGGIASRPDPKLLLSQTMKAADDPVLKNTPAGQGLNKFLTYFNQANKAWADADASHKGTGWMQAQSEDGVALRTWVRQVKEWLTKKQSDGGAGYGEFGPLYEGVFDRAMRNDS